MLKLLEEQWSGGISEVCERANEGQETSLWFTGTSHLLFIPIFVIYIHRYFLFPCDVYICQIRKNLDRRDINIKGRPGKVR